MRRLAILAGLMVFLAVFITPTLNSYLQQQNQIDQLGSQVNAQRKDVADKQAQLKKWDSDPKFVQQQARDRLGFVTPGQTLTVLVDENGKKVSTADPAGKPVSSNPWYGQLWQSALAANRSK